MNIIIPVAGKGSRMRPFTHTKPKPLLPVAGKPIIDHILDRVLSLNPTSITFVTGHLKDHFEEYVRRTYPDLDLRFVEQARPRGSAQAIMLAREAFDEDVLIIFCDTIFDVDLSVIKNSKTDGIFWGQRVKDWHRFGVMVTDEENRLTKIVEKPKEFVSDLANIGLYYIKNTKLLQEGLAHALRRLDTTDDEIYHVEAFRHMLENGANIAVLEAKGWYDCGTMEETLKTNRVMLDKHSADKEERPRTIPPVAIHPTATIENSTIGPYVSIGANVTVRNSTLKDCIVDECTLITDCDLHESIIGQHVEIHGKKGRFSLGDNSTAKE